jgi:high affinity Mn2+ porin
VDAATFDYAADAWGYTYGAAGEWYVGRWTTRLGVFDLSGVPNSKNLDKRFHQYQLDAELERRFQLFGQAGALRLTGFDTHGRMGRYDDAVALAELTGEAPEVSLVRHYHSRPGLSFNLEQALSADAGLFVRAGESDGRYEGYEFTDISKTLAGGVSIKGARWGRADDAVGLAGAEDWASPQAQAYFNAGGLGILAGDGRLPHPGAERILESYYSCSVIRHVHISFDYQYIANPAFNRDRGPVSVFGLRVHAQI